MVAEGKERGGLRMSDPPRRDFRMLTQELLHPFVGQNDFRVRVRAQPNESALRISAVHFPGQFCLGIFNEAKG